MDPVAPLVALVEQTGKLGFYPALLAAGLVGMTLAIILLARLGGTWDGVKARRGAVALQTELIAMVAANRATEDALRRRLDAAERDRTLTRDELDEARSQVALLRNQRRRLVSMMRELVARLPEPGPVVHGRSGVT